MCLQVVLILHMPVYYCLASVCKGEYVMVVDMGCGSYVCGGECLLCGWVSDEEGRLGGVCGCGYVGYGCVVVGLV